MAGTRALSDGGAEAAVLTTSEVDTSTTPTTTTTIATTTATTTSAVATTKTIAAPSTTRGLYDHPDTDADADAADGSSSSNGDGDGEGDDWVYVPVSLAFRSDLASLDGAAPAVVRVYGCYGVHYPLLPLAGGFDGLDDDDDQASAAAWSAADLPLLDRGVVVAHVHVRGGGDVGGVYWHEEGRHLLKRNAVSDLRACLEALQGLVRCVCVALVLLACLLGCVRACVSE
jgi:hypothetical protein